MAATPSVSSAGLQALADRAAQFNVYAEPYGSATAIQGPQGIAGVRAAEVWRRFRVSTTGPGGGSPLRARNEIGEVIASMSQRWLFCPPDFTGAPDRTPPPARFDPTRPQRVVLLGGQAAFGGSGDGFTCFGAGHTLPGIPGEPVGVMAVGAVLRGNGKLRGLDEGTLAYCGTLDPSRGFEGNVFVRIMDRDLAVRTGGDGPAIQAVRAPTGYTYLLFRGQAAPSDPVDPRLGPDGKPAGLTVVQALQELETDCWLDARLGIQSSDRIGPAIGRITAHVAFDPSAPGGGALDPIPFATLDEFEFHDPHGRPAGTMVADSSEGRVFRTLLSGQPAIRFAGVGRIHGGRGPLAGIHGLMTDSSLVVFEPHVSASVYILRVPDAGGRYRRA